MTASTARPNSIASADTHPPDGDSGLLHRLKEAIEHAAHLLPSQGPIDVFIHHNTLHAFEDLPFEKAVQTAAQRFGGNPYLAEERYRQELERGRIRFADLHEVVAEDLGDRADERVLDLCTRRELWLAMLQSPLRTGPTEELIWHVAETDALRRVRVEASSAIRARLIADTRRWVMRDLRPGGGRPPLGPSNLGQLFERFDESAIESWSLKIWEEFTLRALWGVCCDGAAGVPPPAASPPPLRHRDLLLAATGADTDELVHDLLIRFCAAFVDQGLSRRPLPRREEGFFRSFAALYRRPMGPPDAWRRRLGAVLARLQDAGIGPLQSIHESLDDLGVPEGEWEEFISATLLALRGWAGMVWQLEQRANNVVCPIPEVSLIEFLAVRLVLDRLALAHTSDDALGFTGPLRGLREAAHRRLTDAVPAGIEPRAFVVFKLAQLLGWTPERLHHLDAAAWKELLREIEAFSALERRRIFHLAYERSFYVRSLDAVALHAPRAAPPPRRPRFQAMFCIDEREESLRRHLEELAPDAETFSVAGFFFVPMFYRGASEAHFAPLCPAVMRPHHWVVEQVVGPSEEADQRRERARHALGALSHWVHVGSRAFAAGALIAGAAGVLATAPLVARTLAPRLTARIRQQFGRLLAPHLRTRLLLERTEAEPGPGEGHVGFSLDEMADNAERVLRDIGLTDRFARLVLVIGHGSSSLNNPHKAAYDCGACGGARGGPNARALAQMLNDPRVRERLAQRDLPIPDETHFVGGMHNTSCEGVTFYDTDLMPASLQEEWKAVRADIERACDHDAHERSRRFDSAPLTLTAAAARQHVEKRAEDLGQVRPELGHATNALSLVGRRQWSRGLFLDRRAFLTSYDPTQDDTDGSILTRVLLAIAPVCAGINLEYYFSCVDNPGWGSGTKLPHNITGLLGVMDGAGSDLRTGLPWQMVEIHEPVRLLNVVETTPEMMSRILERNAGLARLCRNGWMRLAVLHPETHAVSIYRDGRFQVYQPQAASLPRATSSIDWYRGWRDHLDFAEIEP